MSALNLSKETSPYDEEKKYATTSEFSETVAPRFYIQAYLAQEGLSECEAWAGRAKWALIKLIYYNFYLH